MKQRKFTPMIAGLLCTAFFITSCKEKDQGPADYDHQAHALLAEAAFAKANENRPLWQLICWRIPDHYDSSAGDFLITEEMMNARVKNEVKHTVQEMSVFFQDAVDRLWHGEISKETFIAILEVFLAPMEKETSKEFETRMEKYADTIIAYSQHNIQFHCLDLRAGIIDPEHEKFYFEEMPEFIKSWIDYLEKHPEHFQIPDLNDRVRKFENFRSHYKNIVIRLLMKDASDWHPGEGGPKSRYERSRYRLLKGDPRIGKLLQKRIGKDRAEVVWGANHLRRKKGDIDARFGKSQTYDFAISNNTEQRNTEEQKILADLKWLLSCSEDDIEDPDAIIYLDTLSLMQAEPRGPTPP